VTIIISLFFLHVTPCSLVDDTNVFDEPTASTLIVACIRRPPFSSNVLSYQTTLRDISEDFNLNEESAPVICASPTHYHGQFQFNEALLPKNNLVILAMTHQV